LRGQPRVQRISPVAGRDAGGVRGGGVWGAVVSGRPISRCIYYDGCLGGCTETCGDGRANHSAEERQRRVSKTPGLLVEYSTRDPRHSGLKSAILARLRDRLRIAGEFREPAGSNWRKYAAQHDLLKELIEMVEGMQDVPATDEPIKANLTDADIAALLYAALATCLRDIEAIEATVNCKTASGDAARAALARARGGQP
jgi:hypothetical protein